jgi:hemerythrin-like domain-containing protein
MKRSEKLQPLSREHHRALTLAKVCERAALSGETSQVELACQRAIRAFSDELEPHFQIEEQEFLPLLNSPQTQPLAQRTLAEHRQLRGLLDGLRRKDEKALAGFATCLTGHVRFEEKQLFVVLEHVLQAQETTGDAT